MRGWERRWKRRKGGMEGECTEGSQYIVLRRDYMLKKKKKEAI